MIRFKKNNKGSTIVLVLVVLALVGVMATVALYISLTNFQMKVTDQHVTNSFYSAEGVLDEICVGLQSDVSVALDSAYTAAMSNYFATTNPETAQADRQNTFAVTYINVLRSRLRYGATIVTDPSNPIYEDSLCDLSRLKNYVSMANAAGTYLHSDNGNTDYCVMSTLNEGVVIKDLVIEYTDSDGYLSIIKTDLLLKVPQMNMLSSASVTDIFAYSLIGQGGIDVNLYNTTIEGNVFSGADFNVTQPASVDLPDAEKLIVAGDVNITGQAGSTNNFTISPNGELWATNINVNGSSAGLYGKNYVADDLTLNGTSPKVEFSTTLNGITTGGYYVGYGDSNGDEIGDTDATSSAILINGKNSILDLSGIDSMVVAGYGYIGTSAVESGTETPNKDILIGESISVKGDQIAYLVPPECIGTLTSGTESKFNKNPLSYSDYNLIIGDPSTYQMINLDSKILRTGETLRSYLADENSYYKIFVPDVNAPGGGLVYLYLKMDSTVASSYFLKYYNANKERLDRYTDFYTDGVIALGENSMIYTAGTYAQYTSEDGVSYGYGVDPINGNVPNLPTNYNNLCHTLEGEASSEELSKTVYENTIDQTKLVQFVGAMGSGTFTDSVITSYGTMHVVLVNGNYTFSEAVSATDGYLIIATGNVTINSSLNGTVIAGGKITIGGESVSTSNIHVNTLPVSSFKKLLGMQVTNGAQTAYVYNFFYDGSSYVADDLSVATSDIKLNELVTYANWKKQ